jgi:integrase
MASIRKRNGKWQVQVRRTGRKHVARSFINRADAQAWARKIERDADNGDVIVDRRSFANTTVGELSERYRDAITPSKRSAGVETYILGTILAHPISALSLLNVTASAVARYRDDRLKQVKTATVRRELAVLQHSFEVARKEWGFPLQTNPVTQITIPQAGAPRDWRLNGGGLDQLLKGCELGRTPLLAPIIEFAVETGMRRGEIVAALWVNVDLEARTLHIPMSKYGFARTIPLTPGAVDIFTQLPSDTDRVFPTSGNAVRLAWERLKSRVGVEDLRFHDLRHEAIIRFFEMGLSVTEVALISGHRDTRMLFRYTHLKPEDMAPDMLVGSMTSKPSTC